LPYWTQIIDAVHAVFNGALTYSASWNTASEVSFWSQLNYEGIDCYIPLSNAANPTLQQLINAWIQPATQSSDPGAYAVIGNESPIQYFENLAAQSGKPLIFTELGYANDSSAAADPAASGNSPDPTLQANLYQAFFKAWEQAGNSSLVGTYFWEWDPNGSTSNVGPTIDSFSPQNSPAQTQVSAGFQPASVNAGATLEISSADSASVTFAASTGMLKLDQPSTFSGEIFGFTGNGTLAGSDQIDLAGMNYNTVHDSYANGVLTVTDGTNTVNLNFSGTYSLGNFKFADDGSGGTIVYDPPVPNSPVSGTNMTVSADHSNDAFVFHPNLGQSDEGDHAFHADSAHFDHAGVAQGELTALHDAHETMMVADAAHDTITFHNALAQSHHAHFLV
jgi:hypothetical protein